MDVQNRLKDVSNLRSEVCQEFIRMILKEGWQQLLYDYAQDAVVNNRKWADKCRAVYRDMRDNGIEAYPIEKMDVTLIFYMMTIPPMYFSGIKPICDHTLKAMRTVKDDRNEDFHSGGHEEPDELYLCGLLALCHLRTFVQTVDEKEVTIEDGQRLAYCQNYISRIKELMDLLDKERIELIQRTRDIEQDVQKLLNSESQARMEYVWDIIFKKYQDRYYLELREGKEYPDFLDFLERASDAGITMAYSWVVLQYSLELVKLKALNQKSEIDDVIFKIEQWMEKVYLAVLKKETSLDSFKGCIQSYLSSGFSSTPTEKMREMIRSLQEKGFSIGKELEALISEC